MNRKIRKEQNTISFDDQIKRFVYFLERISKYNVAIETMLVLKEEKEDKSNYIDVGGFTIKLIKKYQGKKFNTVQKDKSNKCEGKAFTLEKLIKERETLGLRKVLYSSQKNVAKDLLVNAKKEHNNGLLYCSQMTTLYRELFVRRKASKHTKESANKIIYNLYTTNYDRKSYYNLLLGYPATPSPYDLFKAKRKYRRQLDFLDQKFIRGYFFDKEVKDEYDYYIVSAEKTEKPKEWTFERIYDIIKCKEKTENKKKACMKMYKFNREQQISLTDFNHPLGMSVPFYSQPLKITGNALGIILKEYLPIQSTITFPNHRTIEKP